MKRVCLIRYGYYPSDPRVRKEAEALAADGFEVDVICLKKSGQGTREKVNGVNVRRLPLGKKRRGMVRYMAQYLLSLALFSIVASFLYFKRRYAVMQVNTMPDILVFVTLVPRLFGAKVVIDMHEAMPELLMSKFGLSEKHPLTRTVAFCERISTMYANRVLVVGESIVELYIKRGLKRSKTVLIPNVPDDLLFDHVKHMNSNFIRDKREFVLISHGSVLKRYGYQTLLKALPHLIQSIPNIKVRIIGDGEYTDSIRELVTQLGLRKYVDFMGRIPHDDIPMELSRADIGIVPIIKDEFTDIMAPNKLFEYIAIKKPVIASRIRGIQDFFDESCIAFFESGDEKELARRILELHEKPEISDNLVKNAWLKYEKLRWRETKQAYCRVFWELAEGRSFSTSKEGIKESHRATGLYGID